MVNENSIANIERNVWLVQIVGDIVSDDIGTDNQKLWSGYYINTQNISIYLSE